MTPVFRVVASLLLAAALTAQASASTLLNVSYDPTRELYSAYNVLFADYWKKKTGETVEIRQSNGGSGAQARAVIEGLEADVVTLALAYDIDSIVTHAKLIAPDWAKRLPDHSTPYTSTIVFLVRKGNPKGIHDWNDVVRPGISVVTPNPKTSGGARWNFLAAYSYALKRNHNDDAAARAFVAAVYKNTGVLDSGARGATITFAERGIGDVLLAWENEAIVQVREHPGEFEIVEPSVSILAEPPVAVVDVNVAKHGTQAVATEYLKYLYSEPAQELVAKWGYRPRSQTAAKAYASSFPHLDLTSIEDFGGWTAAQTRFFADGGVFDQIYSSK